MGRVTVTAKARVALLTGASGFIGGHLAVGLLEEGWEVHALGRPSERFRGFAARASSVACHEVSPDGGDLRSTVEDIAPCVCFHLATYFVAEHGCDDVGPLISANVDFPARLADALAGLGGVTLVNAGTAWQHRDGQPYAPANLYAATKQAFEDIARYYADSGRLAVVNVKFFDTYGPGDTRAKLMNLLLRARREGTELRLSPGEQLVDLLHVSDAVGALRSAYAATQTGTPVSYAASSGTALTLRALVAVFEEATGGPLRVTWGATPYRGLEMFQPWDAGPPPPGWSPKVPLGAGFRQLWDLVAAP